ncbi:hypothetical protein [Streptomyces sp. NBRC 110465]|uniref:hypothetical protein n=1 Tax=Streptomyces sp. NBRC 110465 TaxID=1897621 RepID=UPI0009338F6E|nr:hypothetical protein [Streptomyces sp. NBRC 110465]
MTDFPQLAEWARGHAVAIAAAVALAVILAAVLIAVTLKRRGMKGRDLAQEDEAGRRKFSAGTLAAVAAFIICTSVSLNTSYRFTGDPDGLDMTSTPERLLACAAFESLMAMCVLGARERMADTDSRSGGWYGSAVWVFAALSAVPAFEEGNGLTSATAVRIIVGSFGSALAAHSALGLELRHRTGEESQTAMAQIMRDLRERLMARLGLAHRSRSAEEIARERALGKAVDLYDQYTRLPDGEKTKRKGQRIARRLAIWQDRAELATNEAQRDLYRARVAQRQYATKLRISDAESPWNQPSAAQVQARALDTLEGQARHMEGLADDAEAALRAQIGTPPAAHGGTPVPGPRTEAAPEGEPEADEEPAERIDPADTKPAEPPRAAAAHGGTPRVITARVPQESDEAEGEEPEPEAEPLRDLRSYPTKRAALEALYRNRIAPDDPRTTNAIAEELRTELAEAGITLDRGPANRYIGPLRPQQDERQEDQADADSRELVNA